MSRIYTDIQIHSNKLYVKGYDEKGKVLKEKVDYKPTLFIPSDRETEYRDIHGVALKPKQFSSIRECKKYLWNNKDVENFEIWGTDNHIFQYIQDEFQVDEWVFDQINIGVIDIECQSEGGFPDIETAPAPITTITLKNSKNSYYIAWGLTDYDPQKSILTDIHIKYIQCENEIDLLLKFLEYWRNNFPDVITGWNSKFFDIPYLHSRLLRVFGEDYKNDLSPWRIEIVSEQDLGGKLYKVVELLGIQSIDYLLLFKKLAYTYGTQESYSLDYISNVVLGESKLHHGNLAKLYEENPQLFQDYNIRDVQLVNKIEEKVGLLYLAIMIAYRSGVNFSDSLKSVPLWDAILNRESRKIGIIEKQKTRHKSHDTIIGAYVKEPKKGIYDWVCSFDLNSLYPHLLVQYNMSPETIINQTVDGAKIDDLLDKKPYDIPEGTCMTARGNLFSTKKKGFIPEIIEKYYADRSKIKKEMLKYEQILENVKMELENLSNEELLERKKECEKQIARLGTQQMAIKILTNALYGSLSNEYFRYYDIRIAESVTLSGQLSIKWAEKNLNTQFNKFLNTKDKNYVLYVDTDATYLHLYPLIKDDIEGKTDNEIVKMIDEGIVPHIEQLLEQSYDELQKYMQAPANKMVMAREAIARKGLWTGKKKYILNVLNNEGVQYKEPKVKVVGLESVRSSTPAVCRNFIKETIDKIMKTSEEEVQKDIQEKRKQFKKFSIEEIALPRGIGDNMLDKYKGDHDVLYTKKTPMHVRAALLYNHCLAQRNLESVYPQINSGDKFKFVSLKEPNMVRENVIGFPEILPPEFELNDDVDYDTHFKKAYLEPIKTILTAIGWNVEHQITLF